jgi:hypothetical protein
MPVQFSGTLDPGQYQEWGTSGWSPDIFVQWSVRPSAGQVGIVSLRALAVESAEDGTLTYVLTVWNVGPGPVTFDAVYAAVTTVATVHDDDVAYTLGAGQSIDLDVFGVPPTLINLIAIPQLTGSSGGGGGQFVCSTPSIVLSPLVLFQPETATYPFTVTNLSNYTGAFRMRAALT